MILLFLFGVKKKKLTKRKNTGFRFEAAPEQLSSEAQELAPLKQPALLFAEIHSYTFRLKTKAGTFYLFKQFPTVRFRKSESNRREYRVVRTCHIPFRKGCKLPTYRQRTSAAWGAPPRLLSNFLPLMVQPV